MISALLDSPALIGVAAHVLAGLAFAFLTALLVVAWTRGRPEPWLLAACLATSLWGWTSAHVFAVGPRWGALVVVLDVARSALWLGLPLALTVPMWAARRRRTLTVALTLAIAVPLLFVLATDLPRALVAPASEPDGLGFIARVLVAVVGMLLVENLYRNTRPDYRWTVRPLCLGVGGLFAYDFFMYSDATLFHRIDPDLADVRGVIAMATAAMMALHLRHHPNRSLSLSVSRQTMFHTATFIGAGVYLLLMWGVAAYLRDAGGQWGPLLQAGFLASAFLMLAGVMFSATYGSWLRLMISKHFFRYRYDYRREWLRLIDTISSDQKGLTLAEKVVQAIADIVDSPEGVLWLRDDERRFEAAGAWQTVPPSGAHQAEDDLIAFLETSQRVVDLVELADRPEAYAGLVVPEWLHGTRRPWLIVPLIRGTALMGLVVLHQARTPRPLDWEDFDLLATVGRQAAHFLAEQRAARALERSRQFDEFTRRFAFVLHDIKNLVSQLSLLLDNAERHRDNPEFREDMMATIQESVTKMNHLLVRLHQGGKDAAAASAIDLGAVVSRVVNRYAVAGDEIAFERSPQPLLVRAEEERLIAVMAHLIDNAVEAARGEGVVVVRIAGSGDEAAVEIVDDGPGMDADYLHNHLFQPFVSTKGGYGIGLYESREYVREIGGRMEVSSQPGDGTSVQVMLPLVAPSIAAPAKALSGGAQ